MSGASVVMVSGKRCDDAGWPDSNPAIALSAGGGSSLNELPLECMPIGRLQLLHVAEIEADRTNIIRASSVSGRVRAEDP